jgi:hypothetical protein
LVNFLRTKVFEKNSENAFSPKMGESKNQWYHQKEPRQVLLAKKHLMFTWHPDGRPGLV